MISKEREDELKAIAYEIFEALATERYEPSERGAGWAPTKQGVQDVVAILGRAKARLWKDSPAERRGYAISKANAKAKKVAEKLLGKDVIKQSQCIHCYHFIQLAPDKYWTTLDGLATCTVRKSRNDRSWDHQPTDGTQ